MIDIDDDKSMDGPTSSGTDRLLLFNPNQGMPVIFTVSIYLSICWLGVGRHNHRIYLSIFLIATGLGVGRLIEEVSG